LRFILRGTAVGVVGAEVVDADSVDISAVINGGVVPVRSILHRHLVGSSVELSAVALIAFLRVT
jgi:hypothetical protein